MATVKHTSEKVAEGVGAVLAALTRPQSGPLVTAEETGLDGSFLLDLYATGYLWIARRGGGVAFGVTRKGRKAWSDAQALAGSETRPNGSKQDNRT